MKTTVAARGQTVVPARIRKDHQIGSHTQLEWIGVEPLSEALQYRSLDHV